MSETTSHGPVASHSHQPPYPQYSPPPPGVRPDIAFTPVPRPPRYTNRRWPGLVGVAAASAAITATVTALVTSQVVRSDNASGHPPAPAVTVTATPATPAPPAPLPTAQADRQTCNAWHSAGDQMHAAVQTLSVLPKGMTIADQAVRDNPDWSAAVQKAAALYGRAGDTLLAGVAPGTTTILSQTAHAASEALHALATADATLDAAGGNTYNMMHESSDAMDVLCERLAPR